MTEIIDPYSVINDISITLVIYDNWQQTTRRAFSLRNLSGRMAEEQIAHARQIMDEIAVELHYITGLGIDKGVIRVKQKKVSENLYPDLRPHETVRYFRYGVNIRFYPVFTYQWQKGNKKTWGGTADMIEDGWEVHKTNQNKKESFRLPVNPAFNRQDGLFFSYRGPKKKGRKVIGWHIHYDREDLIFQRFIARFYDTGNLSFGEKQCWAGASRYVEISDTFWTLPKTNYSKAPRKTQIASQPTDNTDYVYIIRMGQTKFYKIGKTNDPQGRLASLQTASPYKLKLLHVFQADNASAAEEALHAKFHSSRLEGEWFKLTDDERKILLSVEKYQNHGFIVDGVEIRIGNLFNS